MEDEKNIGVERYIQELHSIIFFTWVRLFIFKRQQKQAENEQEVRENWCFKGFKEGLKMSQMGHFHKE